MYRFQLDHSLNYNKVSIMPSLRCDANCTHCLFLPELRRASKYDPKIILGAIDSMPRSVQHVSLTGGEPFFKSNILFEIARRISKNEAEFSIVTNGLWTRRAGSVINTITELRALGLTGISISFDEYHQPRLKEDELFDILTIISSCGIRVEIKSCGSNMKAFIDRTKKRFKRMGILLETEHFSLERVGKAIHHRKDFVKHEISRSCRMIFWPLIFPDGTVFACCGAKILEFNSDWLIRGNTKNEPIDKILRRAERDFRLIAVAALGPAGLAKIVGVKPKEDETSCELCVRILNNDDYRKEIEERLEKDKKLRQLVVGRFFLLSHKLYEREKKQREKWREYFRRIGVEK